MKICVQTGDVVDQLGFEKGYAAIAKAGFEGIDWGLFSSIKYSEIKSGNFEGKCVFEKDMDEILAHYEPELAEIRKNGLVISQAHAPFPAFDPEKPYLLDYMIKMYKKMILLCDRVGCKYLVVHGYSLPKNVKSVSAAEVDAINDKLYASLIPELKETDVTLCLENLFTGWASSLFSGVCSDPREAVEMIDAYNQIAGKECFGFCVDIGHLNLLKIDIRRYLPIVGDRIKCLHIHDNSGYVDEHKAPYTGTVDWKEFYKTLKQIGYKGDLSFETFNQVSLNYIDEELLMPWLELICTVGKHFRKKILE